MYAKKILEVFYLLWNIYIPNKTRSCTARKSLLYRTLLFVKYISYQEDAEFI
ncbi:hypothetical protein MAMMFC1_03192 [Methylomusa anaerophila]|uniref:Uncharacterized protein n=1 Tax=Methylomusa anaerophila TaxID=1930071 RepID=A0A348AN51_9FIRM|nr:hypothetical protein MAMMFC1_03192 [Methylomusa anaerophila]